MTLSSLYRSGVRLCMVRTPISASSDDQRQRQLGLAVLRPAGFRVLRVRGDQRRPLAQGARGQAVAVQRQHLPIRLSLLRPRRAPPAPSSSRRRRPPSAGAIVAPDQAGDDVQDRVQRFFQRGGRADLLHQFADGRQFQLALADAALVGARVRPGRRRPARRRPQSGSGAAAVIAALLAQQQEADRRRRPPISGTSAVARWPARKSSQTGAHSGPNSVRRSPRVSRRGARTGARGVRDRDRR